ncbi:hypothetical protein B0H21DRAFT_740581 [Amylocystis lapponica]|nr:hypothetical protein B0H21DRAFT_740581 [Amylocystis lapponica]
MRERAKAMEDICYFLVSKVQGGREHAKAILPTYPCLQPSDTTAFRMSLAKHLETLRHGIVYPGHADMKPNTTSKKNQAKVTSVTSTANAWWWKDVMVRRSILEECCGERFEQLLLALSTHALLKTTRSAATVSVREQTPPSQTEGLGALSQKYALLLSSALSGRRTWESSASLLVQRQSELTLLRERLANPDPSLNSKYDSLSTDRLLALRESRLQDLLRTHWQRDGGQYSLQFLTDIVGLQIPHSPSVVFSIDEGLPALIPQTASKTTVAPLPPSPLPIAAAHHPTQLRALSLPLFSGTSLPSSQIGGSSNIAENPAVHSVIERVDTTVRIQQALQDALARAESVRRRLKTQLENVRAVRDISTKTTLDLWERSAHRGVDFETAATPALFDTFDLPRPQDVSTLEKRIADIRSTRSLPIRLRLRQPSDKGSWHVDPSSLAVVNKTVHKGKETRPAAPTKTRSSAHVESPHPRQPRLHKSIHPPALSSARRTGRVSTARARRSGAAARKTSLDVEVDRILEAVHDTDEIVAFDDVASTPVRHRTPGVPLSSVKKSAARPSFDIEKHERAGAKLPALRLSDAQEESDGGESGEWTYDEPQALANVQEDEEDFCEGRSVTLKDILLGAQGDATQYDLLGADDLGEESLDWE